VSDLPDVSDLTIGVLGGTGPQGRGLAFRWASVGQRVLLGSREAPRAEKVAGELSASLPAGAEAVRGDANAVVAGDADVVIVAVPWDGHADTLEAIRDRLVGKVVVDCVNPLGFDGQGPYPLRVPEGSAAEQAASMLPLSRVTAAFHHVSAVLLADPEVPSLDTDVLVLGDERADTDLVQALAERLPGVRGVYAGRLRNAHQVEALTANLIAINRRYRAHAGFRVTDV
jgi:NADPH-dependent F420 reductase